MNHVPPLNKWDPENPTKAQKYWFVRDKDECIDKSLETPNAVVGCFYKDQGGRRMEVVYRGNILHTFICKKNKLKSHVSPYTATVPGEKYKRPFATSHRETEEPVSEIPDAFQKHIFSEPENSWFMEMWGGKNFPDDLPTDEKELEEELNRYGNNRGIRALELHRLNPKISKFLDGKYQEALNDHLPSVLSGLVREYVGSREDPTIGKKTLEFPGKSPKKRSMKNRRKSPSRRPRKSR